jgi:hypothetical protein
VQGRLHCAASPLGRLRERGPGFHPNGVELRPPVPLSPGPLPSVAVRGRGVTTRKGRGFRHQIRRGEVSTHRPTLAYAPPRPRTATEGSGAGGRGPCATGLHSTPLGEDPMALNEGLPDVRVGRCNRFDSARMRRATRHLANNTAGSHVLTRWYCDGTPAHTSVAMGVLLCYAQGPLTHPHHNRSDPAPRY